MSAQPSNTDVTSSDKRSQLNEPAKSKPSKQHPHSAQQDVSTRAESETVGRGKQSGASRGRKRYYGDRPRYQRGDDKADIRYGNQERQPRNQVHRNNRRKDVSLTTTHPCPKSGYRQTDKDEVPHIMSKATSQATNEATMEQTKTMESRKPDVRRRQDGGQPRNSPKHGRQRRPKSPYRGVNKTSIESKDISNKMDNTSTKKLDSELPPEQSNSSERQLPESKTVFKSYNYTKPKPEKQQYKSKSRFKGQRSTPTVQSDQLAQQLTAGTYECMVCCECVRGRDQVWSCEGCYHVFHLKCIKKWASAPVLGIDEGECVFF